MALVLSGMKVNKTMTYSEIIASISVTAHGIAGGAHAALVHATIGSGIATGRGNLGTPSNGGAAVGGHGLLPAAVIVSVEVHLGGAVPVPDHSRTTSYEK